MEDIKLIPYTLETDLTGYLPIPRNLLDMDLPSTAILIYGVLLDRATLSRKNAYADGSGWVYAVYPVEHLGQALHISGTAVKRHLGELESRGLIRRCREVRNSANHIYLRLPSASIKETNRTPEEAKTAPPTGRKVSPNNRKKQLNISNYYQHGEDESL